MPIPVRLLSYSRLQSYQSHTQQKALTKPQQAAYDKIGMLVAKLSLPNDVAKQAQWIFRQLVASTKEFVRLRFKIAL